MNKCFQPHTTIYKRNICEEVKYKCKILQRYHLTWKDPTASQIAVETNHFHDLCATVSTISRSFVSIGRKKHATAASKAANPYTAVANMRDDCMRTCRTNKENISNLKFCVHFTSPQCMVHTLPISFSLIQSP